MRELTLTKGKTALVDKEDFYWVSQWNWFAVEINGVWYAKRSKKKGILRTGIPYEIYLHRVVTQCTDKNLLVHHKDHNGLNCQKFNLIQCTKAENNTSTSSHKDSLSKYLGVSYNKEKWRNRRWTAQLNHNGIRVLCKRFLTEEEAAKAYDNAAKECFGKFANLNFK